MSALSAELLGAGFFLVVGWIALWPLRDALGAYAYHLAALPTGLLAAALAGGISTVMGRPLDVRGALAGGVVLIAAVWALHFVVFGRTTRGDVGVDLRSYLIASGTFVGLVGVLGATRFTVSNNDSLVSYWPLGVSLNRGAAFTEALMAARSPLLPSMNAIFAAFGSDWAYVIYPLLGATVLAWVGYTLWLGPLAVLGSRSKWLVVAGAVGFLALEPAFVFHSFFVHSHMASGVYLLMALTCLWIASRVGLTPAEKPAADVFLLLAGLFTAGLALARPDGLAYQFVPVAAAISVLTLSKVRGRAVLAFFGPYLFVLVATYAAAYVALGMWPSSKLSGRTALAILGVAAFSAMGAWIVEALDRVLPFRIRGESFLGILVGVSAALMLGVFALKWGTASGALETARINLFQGAGGYGYLWYAVVIVLALSLVTGDALAKGSWTRPAFLAVSLFFVIAGLVHGISHEGRIGVGDSFNRVAFEAFPVIVWYGGALAARVLGGSRGASEG